jgi:hypothetical protein
MNNLLTYEKEMSSNFNKICTEQFRGILKQRNGKIRKEQKKNEKRRNKETSMFSKNSGAVMDEVVKRKIPIPRRESNRRTPIVQPVAQRYTDGAITVLFN